MKRVIRGTLSLGFSKAARRLLVALMLSSSSGCGPTLFVIDTLPASSILHEVEVAGAKDLAPYEYWSAHELLDKAAEEANEGNYLDAIRYAERARAFGEDARGRIRAARRRAASR